MEIENNAIMLQAIAAIFIGGFVFLFVYIVKVLNREEEVPNKNSDKEKSDNTTQLSEKRKDNAQVGKSRKKGGESGRWSGRSEKQAFSHPWLLTTLKGHTGQVLDMEFSSNGKYLASCAEDRTVVLWDTKDITQKNHKSTRINIDFDHPTLITWSPDSTAFIINKSLGNNVEVYRVEKKKDGSLTWSGKSHSFPKVAEEDNIALGIESHGRYIMTCTNKTSIFVFDLKGNVLTSLDTYLMNTSCAKISPCGKFIVASGFAPDVKVWEVIFNKANEFQEAKRAFELTGHSSGVCDVAFDQETSHMATVSNDGTWKLFDTKIDYKRKEDPHLKITGSYEKYNTPAKIALSPNAEVVAIASGNTLAFYSTFDGKMDQLIENICLANMTNILFDSSGNYVLTAGDKHIQVFHNVTGYRCNIESAKDKLRSKQTSATKERLEKSIKESEKFLESIKEK